VIYETKKHSSKKATQTKIEIRVANFNHTNEIEIRVEKKSKKETQFHRKRATIITPNNPPKVSFYLL